MTTDVVFYGMDAEKGEGIEIARRYGVRNFPTFILVDAGGDVLDRWMGYDDVPTLLGTMDVALEDPMTVDARIQRFRSEPTAKDAERLGGIRYASGYYGDAVAYYRHAESLGANDLAYDIFEAASRGAMVNGLYPVDDVARTADAAVAEGCTPEELAQVASMMMYLAKGDAAIFTPYLTRAVEATEGVEEMAEVRARLLPDYALHVTGDVDAAVAYKKATLADDWQESANGLNGFAWWCFENEINLDEAEALARKGVELAAPGRERANVLDTLAELCNLKGDCGEAVELIRRAVEESPSNEYFKSQLARFEAILAEQQQG